MITQQLAMFGPAATSQAMINPAGVIYETKGRAREYRQLACNLYTGCDHRCVYCYAPDIMHRDRDTFGDPVPRKNIMRKLSQDVRYYAQMGERRQIMFCFACDPYQTIDERYAITRQAIQACHANGLDVCVLTKGGHRALRDLDLFTERDAFATTLTCLDDTESLEWEPGAALPGDRIDTLGRFHDAGVPTWVSIEPVVDPAVSLDIIRQTHHVVDEFKVGRLNYHPRANQIDWHRFAHDARDLLESLGVSYYLKHDLRIEL